MTYHHNPALPWRNPENVPLSQIPDGWRLMLPGDEGWPKNACRLWDETDVCFYEDTECDGETTDDWTYIVPSTAPLPEEFLTVEPEAKPGVTVDNSELRDRFAGLALNGMLAHHGRYWQSSGGTCDNLSGLTPDEAAARSIEYADALLRALEARP